METVRFQVPGLDSGEGIDLSNTLTALSGVGSVDVDWGKGSVGVEYDPAYANPGIIRSHMVGAGYRVEGDGLQA